MTSGMLVRPPLLGGPVLTNADDFARNRRDPWCDSTRGTAGRRTFGICCDGAYRYVLCNHTGTEGLTEGSLHDCISSLKPQRSILAVQAHYRTSNSGCMRCIFIPLLEILTNVVQKNKGVRTVVNKLNSIDAKFRFFKMELIAGEPNYVVEHVCIILRFSTLFR
jgi:hypothetical protein